MEIKSYTDNIQMHLTKGNYHAAFNLALSGLNECRRNRDQAGVNHFLENIKTITHTIVTEFDKE
jgi:hypothetical protein